MRADMTTREISQEEPAVGPSIWAGVLGAPAAWVLDFTIRYALVPIANLRGGDKSLMMAMSVLFLAIAGACGVICYLDWRRSGAAQQAGEEVPFSRRTFLAAVGIMSSSLFFLLIIATGLPDFFWHPGVD